MIDDSRVLYPTTALQRIVDEATRELGRLAREYDFAPLNPHDYFRGREDSAENMAHYAAGIAARYGYELDLTELDRAVVSLHEAKVKAGTVRERALERGARLIDGAVSYV